MYQIYDKFYLILHKIKLHFATTKCVPVHFLIKLRFTLTLRNIVTCYKTVGAQKLQKKTFVLLRKHPLPPTPYEKNTNLSCLFLKHTFSMQWQVAIMYLCIYYRLYWNNLFNFKAKQILPRKRNTSSLQFWSNFFQFCWLKNTHKWVNALNKVLNNFGRSRL